MEMISKQEKMLMILVMKAQSLAWKVKVLVF
jgi:hypothetical protein